MIRKAVLGTVRISESFKSKHQDHFVMFAFLIRGGEE